MNNLKRNLWVIGILLCVCETGWAQYVPYPTAGTGSDIIYFQSPYQNQVKTIGNDTVIFIHTRSTAIWGGQEDELMYGMSTNGGDTFISYGDYSPIAGPNNMERRVPQISHSIADSAGVAVHRLPWAAHGTSVSGTFNNFGIIESPGSVNSTAIERSYPFVGELGGLCEGLPGELWTCALEVRAGQVADSLFLFRGILGANDFPLELHTKIHIPHSLIYDGEIRCYGANMAFSPDGSIGWVAFMGDLAPQAGDPFTIHPIFLKTTDGGLNWSSPMEVNLNPVAWLADTLQTGCPSPGNTYPCGNGVPTMGPDFDIVVDNSGAPHLFAVVGNQGRRDSSGGSFIEPYKFQEDLRKVAVDISTPDGGTTWTVTRVAPIHTHKGNYQNPTIGMNYEHYNSCQASRTMDGEHVFFSWVDTDTCKLGVGPYNKNDSPDLFVSGLRVSDGHVPPVKYITDGNFVHEQSIHWASMAPEVMEAGTSSNTRFHLPVIIPLYQGIGEWEFRFVDDAYFDESDFAAPSVTGPPAACPIVVGMDADPIPNGQSQWAQISCYPTVWNGDQTLRLSVDARQALWIKGVVRNNFGQEVVALEEMSFGTGRHIKLLDLPLALPTGVYFLDLEIYNRRKDEVQRFGQKFLRF